MKPSELMIGDWLFIEDANTKTRFNVRVNKIGGSYIYFDCEDVDVTGLSYDCFFPIPLTTEILEKNGWESGGYEEMVYTTDEYCFALQKGVDGKNAWWWEMFSSPIIPINYVHELQHALRLCGIEKEIML